MRYWCSGDKTTYLSTNAPRDNFLLLSVKNNLYTRPLTVNITIYLKQTEDIIKFAFRTEFNLKNVGMQSCLILYVAKQFSNC